jgi:hypothetical protein
VRKVRQELADERRGLHGLDGVTAVVLEARCGLSLGQAQRLRPQGGIDVYEWESLDGARQRLSVKLLEHLPVLLHGERPA